ncbi:MAG: ComEA family DNA-binding protein [Pseudomonadota bacterium]|nr:ComEA family DNA-binding protein [Pseudomonadota bacterium]
MKAFAISLKALLLSVFLFAGTAFANEVVNINTADAATLSRGLHGVGPAKALAIIEYRENNGPFKSVEQLAMVRGIGLKTVEKNIERLSVDGKAPPSKTADAERGYSKPVVSSRQAAINR